MTGGGAHRRGLRAAALGALVVAAALAPRPAEAKLVDLYGALRGGGVVGSGTASGEQSSDFFKSARGPGFGFELGLELLNVNASVNFTQLLDGGGAAGTVTELLLGFDGEIGIDGLRRPKTFIRLGGSAGIALGTHRPVNPPLDNEQVSDKGPILQAVVGVDRYLAPVVTIGLEATAGYHYFAAGPLNSPTSTSSGMHLLIFFTVRAHLEPFR
jgi:hypothetical protein